MTRRPPILESVYSLYQGLPDCNTLNTAGFISQKKTSGLPFLCLLYFLSFRYLFLVLFFNIKKNSMLACRVVCCSYQSDRRIWVCISHQSDCRLKVRISDQSYHSIWIWCINQSVIGYVSRTNDTTAFLQMMS